tara:strand:- start:321 stop:587 length:267 start_codon:yes stop_codon:yes gene_type:complete
MAKPLISISAESIQYIKEDSLKREVFSLENKKSAILRDRDRRRESQPALRIIETEICYLQREIEIRQRRKKAHSNFMQKRIDKRAKRS